MSDELFTVLIVAAAAAGAYVLATSQANAQRRRLEEDLEYQRALARSQQCAPNDLGCQIGKAVGGITGIIDIYV